MAEKKDVTERAAGTFASADFAAIFDDEPAVRAMARTLYYRVDGERGEWDGLDESIKHVYCAGVELVGAMLGEMLVRRRKGLPTTTT